MITALCIQCGKDMEPPYYVNFLEQTFCWPCADGEHPDVCVHFRCSCGAEIHMDWDLYNPCAAYPCTHSKET